VLVVAGMVSKRWRESKWQDVEIVVPSPRRV